MSDRRDDGRGSRAASWLARPAAAVLLAVVALLVLTWPFVRSPPLGLAASYVHLLVAWALLVGALAATARALGGPGGDGGDDA
jgi:hypothetical protein